MKLPFLISRRVVKFREFLFPVATRRNGIPTRIRLQIFVLISVVCVLYFILYLLAVSVPEKDSKQEAANPLHSLCVIVPFRDRFDEMYEFIPHIAKFLGKQNLRHRLLIINQVDSYRFNRGALINVGFLYSTTNISDCDYIAIHDVDLLPLNDNLSYAYPGDEVVHIAAPNLHPLYHYPTFLGGIVIINNDQFRAVNGLSNKYWGWGREDDEFYVRLKNARIRIRNPENVSTNYTNTFRHIHGSKRKRDYKRCFDQKIKTSRRDRITGLSNVDYIIYSARSVNIGDEPVIFVNVELICNRSMTPWCTCDVE